MRPAANRTAIALVLVGLLLGGCVQTSGARSAFARTYSCPSSQVTVRPAGYQAAGYTPFAVTGCGYEAEYDCTVMSDYPLSTPSDVCCTERVRVAFEATDSSLHQAWLDDPEPASQEAAIASAAYDLRCERTSIAFVGTAGTVLQGCGQRVTYRIVGYSVAPPPGHVRRVEGRRFTLVASGAAPAR
jgi:hypothetical protein